VTHPIIVAASNVRASLKAVADANPTFMTTGEKATTLVQLAAAEAQLGELRLRVLADAGDLAEATAAKDAAGWLARQTRTSYADARADVRLATALDRDRPVLAAAMREGAASLPQARVIDRALRNLPAAVDAETVALAEKHLVDRASEFGPKELGRIGRRILDVVAPDIAEAAEAQRLADLEAHAADKTRLTMRRLGDGTTRISSRVPDAAATRLATYLESFANPRVEQHHDAAGTSATPDSPATAHDPVARLAYPRRMGQAFVQLLESLDPTRLPVHGGDATTVVVTIDLDSLKADLATADLVGAGLVQGDELTGDAITAAEARRAPGLHREDPARRARRRQPAPRPRPRPPPVHSRPTQGPAGSRPDLSGRRLRHPRHLVRSPPPRPLDHGRTYRPRQRRPALQSPPPPRPRHHLPHRPPPQRRPPLPPTQIGRRAGPRSSALPNPDHVGGEGTDRAASGEVHDLARYAGAAGGGVQAGRPRAVGVGDDVLAGPGAEERDAHARCHLAIEHLKDLREAVDVLGVGWVLGLVDLGELRQWVVVHDEHHPDAVAAKAPRPHELAPRVLELSLGGECRLVHDG
jgi:hypothetical protein